MRRGFSLSNVSRADGVHVFERAARIVLLRAQQLRHTLVRPAPRKLFLANALRGVDGAGLNRRQAWQPALSPWSAMPHILLYHK